MAVSRLRQYKLPTDDGILVSALYSFHHTLGDKELLQPVIIEMHVCAVVYSLLDLDIEAIPDYTTLTLSLGVSSSTFTLYQIWMQF